MLADDRRKRVYRDEDEQQDLAGKDHVPDAERAVHALAVHREYDRVEDVDDGQDRHQRGYGVSGERAKPAERVLFVEVCDDVARP